MVFKLKTKKLFLYIYRLYIKANGLYIYDAETMNLFYKIIGRVSLVCLLYKKKKNVNIEMK